MLQQGEHYRGVGTMRTPIFTPPRDLPLLGPIVVQGERVVCVKDGVGVAVRRDAPQVRPRKIELDRCCNAR